MYFQAPSLDSEKKILFLTFYWQVMPIKTRSKKGEEEIMSGGDSARFLEKLSKKPNDMNTTQERRHEELCNKLAGLEQKTSTLVTDLKDLKEGLQSLEKDLADVKQDVETKADKSHVLELENRITDLQNRSRRNNIVIWNVRVGSDKDTFMVEFVKRSLLIDHMKLENAENIKIMRAHRTETTIRRDVSNPRPIDVYLLKYTDRQYILANAAICLKENQYDGSSLYISDDVTKDVREQRTKLKEKHLKNLRQRDEVQFAYVAWSVPAKILYKLRSRCLKLWRIGRQS